MTVTGVDRVGSRRRLGGLLQEAAGNDCAVMAFNVVDPASMQGVLDAAEAAEVPVVVQLSVRSARQWGIEAALACHTEASGGRAWPSVLHLDHCADREFAEDCLRAGWDSVLFDASGLPYETAVRQTAELVEVAAQFGGDVEGEFEAIPRVGETRSGGPGEYAPASQERVRDFIGRTGVTCFSPDLGTAHGAYTHQPVVDHERAQAITATTGVPLVLHGGTGLDPQVVTRLVDCGVRKINISTQIKHAYVGAATAAASATEPLEVLDRISAAVREVAAGYCRTFGQRG
ncbi:class II fructose-bisphosphate aldolase [Streptomyces sp. NPDC047197]|uniref:class II fructose-bisphosphate aldolase n=1 Tax=Streptomyces sp. NPDC047197 TaxID=3155477 RepID=UPI0034080E4A